MNLNVYKTKLYETYRTCCGTGLGNPKVVAHLEDCFNNIEYRDFLTDVALAVVYIYKDIPYDELVGYCTHKSLKKEFCVNSLFIKAFNGIIENLGFEYVIPQDIINTVYSYCYLENDEEFVNFTGFVITWLYFIGYTKKSEPYESILANTINVWRELCQRYVYKAVNM